MGHSFEHRVWPQTNVPFSKWANGGAGFLHPSLWFTGSDFVAKQSAVGSVLFLVSLVATQIS